MAWRKIKLRNDKEYKNGAHQRATHGAQDKWRRRGKTIQPSERTQWARPNNVYRGSGPSISSLFCLGANGTGWYQTPERTKRDTKKRMRYVWCPAMQRTRSITRRMDWREEREMDGHNNSLAPKCTTTYRHHWQRPPTTKKEGRKKRREMWKK